MIFKLLLTTAFVFGVGMAKPQFGQFQVPKDVNISSKIQQCEPASHTSVHHVCLLACDCLCNNVRGSVWYEMCYAPCVEVAISNRMVCHLSNTVADPGVNPFANCPLGLSGRDVCAKACACCGTPTPECMQSCQHGIISFLTFNECQHANSLLMAG